MGIKGFTDRIKPAFPEIGRLRKGDPKTDKAPGKDLEWFRFTSERPDVLKAFVAAYGKAPASFDVYLPYTGVDDNFETGRAKFLAGGMEFRCDGRDMTMWRDERGQMHTEKRPCPYCSGERERTDEDPGCVQFGRLTVILPKLLEDAGYVGQVIMETHSYNDIRSILASLRKTAQESEGNPLGLRGIMFHVYRIPEKVSTPFSKDEPRRRARRKKWLVKIEPAAEWVMAQLTAQREAALLADPRQVNRLVAQVLAGVQREGSEILTASGYVNAAHLAGDPQGPETPDPRREALPLGPAVTGAGRLFKTGNNGTDTGTKPATVQEPAEGEFRVPEEPEMGPEPGEPQWQNISEPNPEGTGKPSPVMLDGMPEAEPPKWIDDVDARRHFWGRVRQMCLDRKVKPIGTEEVRNAVGGRLHDCPTVEKALELVARYLDTVARPRQPVQEPML